MTRGWRALRTLLSEAGDLGEELPAPSEPNEVRIFPGQVPEQFAAVVEALFHARRVHAVRMVCDARGFVTLTATAYGPLALHHPC